MGSAGGWALHDAKQILTLNKLHVTWQGGGDTLIISVTSKFPVQSSARLIVTFHLGLTDN